ncbi:MAG: zinc-dependent peptidase [Bacteroidetes bacterium]|nr:zinc-dependent peptidase [Bacteroidota bacterium]
MPYAILKQKNTYFRNLSPDAQEIFVNRLFKFMEDKKFIGREGLVVTDEIKVLISAAAIQLTFGLKDFMISHLYAINVFPRVFFSKYLNVNLKGLNTQSGVLSLSWNDFKEGYAVEDDKVNLGLHELAHALYIDLDEEGNYDEHFSAYFERWEDIAMKDYLELKEKKVDFLREYGGTNMHEFFAVCVEHFFEAPKEFKKQLPHLYNYLMLMLNQDPDNVKGDYQVRVYAERAVMHMETVKEADHEELNQQILNNSNIEERYTLFQTTIQRNGIYIAMISTFIGLFVGIPLLIWFWSTTVISIGAVFILLFFCGALGLIQWKYVKPYLDMEYHQFSMYAFSGFGMCLINFLFCLNTFIPVKHTTVTYEVVAFQNGSHGLEVTLSGEGNSTALERNVINYMIEHFDRYEDARRVVVNKTTGLLGMDRVESCQIIN